MDTNANTSSSPDDTPILQPIVAAQLHVCDVVRRQGELRVVTSLRIQGAPPEVCVEFAGLSGRHHYPATAQVNVLRRRAS